jgi:hypothetical protein
MSDDFSLTGQDDMFTRLHEIADKKTVAAATKALQTEGWDIMTEMVKEPSGVRYAVYRFISAPRESRVAA